jgi:hypothetical protein
LWRFNISSGNWAFLSGSTQGDAVSNYTGLVSPGAMVASGYWQINDSYLYVFGGYVSNGAGKFGMFEALYKSYE